MTKSALENDDIQLHCTNLAEANRMISVLHAQMVLHGQGKRFWMWLFIANVFAAPIAGDFFSGFWSGVFNG